MNTELMTHALWMERTKVSRKPRSSGIRKVDEAVRAYHAQGRSPALRLGVKTALDAWMKSKGGGNKWVRSVRNKNGAVNDLFRQLEGVQVTAADREAIAFLKEHRREALQTLFGGRKLVLAKKWGTALKVANKVRNTENIVEAFANSGEATGGSGSSIVNETKSLIGDILGDAAEDLDFLAVVTEAVGSELEEFIVAISPWVGLVKSAGSAGYYTYKTIKKVRTAQRMTNARPAVLPGDPTAALQAIHQMFEREAKHCGVRAASHAIEATAKSAGMFLDAGTATTAIAGAAGTLARILITLRCLKLDWDETQAANALLGQAGSLDNKLFSTSPILGAYFLVCTDTSTIVNLCFDDLFQPGMRYRVDQAVKKHLSKVKDKANNLILGHRCMLSGGQLPFLSVESDDGRIAVRDAGLTTKLKAAAVNKIRGREGFYV